MNRRQKIIVSVTGIFLVLLLLVGLTYAYFLTRINGNTNTKSISASTANLALVYGDGNGIITGDKIQPGTTLDTKTFTVTNQGNAKTDYVVVIEDVSVTYAETIEVDGVTQTAGSTTTFQSNDFVYTLTCTSDGIACNGVDTDVTFPINGGILVGNSIEAGKTHTYSLTVTYKETGIDQSADMNKKLEAKVNIADLNEFNPYVGQENTLAYNIINNVQKSKTDTMLISENLISIKDGVSTIAEIDYEEPTTYTNTLENAKDYYLAYSDTYLLNDITSGNNAYFEFKLTDFKTVKYSKSIASEIKGKYAIFSKNEDELSYLPISSTTIYKISTNENDITENSVKYAEMSNRYKLTSPVKQLSLTNDDYGVSYFYRGGVEDNYVEFNNLCWRIVRIEGDGSIKIILAAQKKCSEMNTNNFDSSASIGKGEYGHTYDYIANSSGETSNGQVNIADYVNGQSNKTSSIKYQFENWLTSSGIDTSKLKKDNWCLGNTTDPYNSDGTLLTTPVNDLMYNGTSFYYDTYKRTSNEGKASLRCDGKNDESFESYIGTLTVDELLFAGARMTHFSGFYLASYSMFLTLSVLGYEGSGYNLVGVHWSDGSLSTYGVYPDSYGNEKKNFFPAVTLVSGTQINSGDGSIENPYMVQ